MDYLSNMEQTKICNKCGRVLPLNMFYKHPHGKFGFSNKCKECAKEDSRLRYNEMSKDEQWLEHERARGREKYRRLGYKNVYKQAHPSTKNVAIRLRKIVDIPTSCEIHHWNYNLLYDVFILDKRWHARIHKKLSFDENSKCFFLNGELLDTKQKHEQAIRTILQLSQEDEITQFVKD